MIEWVISFIIRSLIIENCFWNWKNGLNSALAVLSACSESFLSFYILKNSHETLHIFSVYKFSISYGTCSILKSPLAVTKALLPTSKECAYRNWHFFHGYPDYVHGLPSFIKELISSLQVGLVVSGPHCLFTKPF